MRSNDIDNITDRHNNNHRITGLDMTITQALLMCLLSSFSFYLRNIFSDLLHCLQNIFFWKSFRFTEEFLRLLFN